MSHLTEQPQVDYLRKAVESHAVALAKVQHPAVVGELHIQFLGHAEIGEVEGFWAKLATQSRLPLDELIASSTPFEVFFQTPTGVASFACNLFKTRGWLWQSKSLFFTWPLSLNVVQRRTQQRERVPDDLEMSATLAVLGAGGESGEQTPVTLFDLSSRGACLICPARPPFSDVKVGQALIVVLQYTNSQLPLAARCRRADASSTNSVIIAVEFESPAAVKDPAQGIDVDKLVADLTRLRLRRHFRSALNYRSHKQAS